MTLPERGLYFEMLNYQWKEGFVPDDQQAVAAHCGVPVSEVRRIWTSVRGHFSVLKNGTLRNTRMETIRRLKIGSYEVRSEKARKSVSVRWQKHKASNTTVIRTDTNKEQRTENKNREDNPPTPLSSGKHPKQATSFYADEGWLEFQREHPNDKRIFEARPAYLDKLNEAADQQAEHRRIIAGCQRAAAFYRTTGTSKKFQENAVDFLTGNRYLESWAADSPSAEDKPVDVSEVMRNLRAKREAEKQ